VKLQPRQVDSFLARPDPKIRAVLFYGPDSGLVRERAVRIAKTVVEDLGDPFRVAELSMAAIGGDPARLHDEMAAMALTGGRRLVRLVEAEDAAAAAFQSLFKELPAGDSLCVVEAGDLGPRAKLRQLFEEEERAAAIACYVEDAGALAQTLGGMLAEQGLDIDPDARTLMASYLVGDRQIARGEVAKLAIYMVGHGTRVGLADVQATIGDSSSLEMDEPALAAADGDIAGVDRALGRLFAEGANPVPVLRAGQRHFQRLQLAAAHMAKGQSAQQALKQLRPPVFFKQEAQMAAQLRRWTGPLLRQALTRLVETEAEVKRTHTPAETVTARAFFQLAQLARRG
jgi:DNA polymerase-3 subunit delta